MRPIKTPDAMRITHNLQEIQKTLRALEHINHRNNQSVGLVVVTKSRSLVDIQTCLDAGIRHLGENYLQEALPKIHALQAYSPIWHYQGRIQSNKIKKIAENFSWVQTVASVDTAKKLDRYREGHCKKLNICIQVNINNEPTKSGISSEDAFDVFSACHILPNIQLRGLMAIPEASAEYDSQKANFSKIHQLFALLRQKYPTLDTLSMGMSQDYPAAVAEGATLVRVGSAIFTETENT
jgi:pyridoxal phosphate enzyme (YggS family)